MFEEDTELLDLIDDERDARQDDIESMYNRYSTLERDAHADRQIEIPSWVYFRPSRQFTGRRTVQFQEYESLFKDFRGGKYLR